MKIEKYICDSCNKEFDDVLHLKDFISWGPDPSGNRYNNQYKYYDVCKKCLKRFLVLHPEADII